MKKLMACLVLTGSVVGLNGCALALHEYRQATTQQTIEVGAPAKYRAQISVSVPFDSCDSDAYIAGVKRGYVDIWNQKVRGRIDYYRLRSSNRPADLGAKQALAIYQGKVIDTEGLPKNAEYQLKMNETQNGCTRYSSFKRGMADGSTKATTDFQDLRVAE